MSDKAVAKGMRLAMIEGLRALEVAINVVRAQKDALAHRKIDMARRWVADAFCDGANSRKKHLYKSNAPWAPGDIDEETITDPLYRLCRSVASLVPVLTISEIERARAAVEASKPEDWE